MNLIPILNAIEEETNIKPRPFDTRTLNNLPAINFLLYRTQDNGAKAQWRLQMRYTAETLAAALALENQVTELLVTVGDSKFNNCVIGSNGGGTLEDEETGLPQILTYYDITTRS